MPKSESKPVVKKTKSVVNNSHESTEESAKVESYVPKITHWTKAKKDKEEIVEPVQIENQSLDDVEITNEGGKSKPFGTKSTTTRIQETPKPDKLAQLKAKSTENTEIQSTSIPQSLDNRSILQKPGIQSKLGLPSFLNRSTKPPVAIVNPETVHKSDNEAKHSTGFTVDENNSLTSIFKRDQDEISNIKRVFRKSIMFLTLALLSFGLSSLASSSFVFQSFLALVFTGFGFIALTNIFFIIVAHRTYVWLFLIGQFIILSITQYPFSTNLSTLIIGFVVVLLTYLAYLDLEKVQLGSRLFSVPYIVGESTKILSSVLVFIVCLSSYNQISSKGLDKFLGESILSVPIFMDKVALPAYQNVIAKGSGLEISDNSNSTVKSLICAERKIVCNTKNNTVLTQEEYVKLNKQCEDTLLPQADCAILKDKSEDTVLTAYLNQDLSGLGLSLNSRLTSSNYQPVLSQIIQNKIKKFVDPSKFSFLPASVQSTSIIPFIVSLILFIILSIFKFILVWFGYIVTWILWKLLQITGFVRLDIEMVEAEIVGI